MIDPSQPYSPDTAPRPPDGQPQSPDAPASAFTRTDARNWALPPPPPGPTKAPTTGPTTAPRIGPTNAPATGPYWPPSRSTSPAGSPDWPAAPPGVAPTAQAPRPGRRLRAAGWVLVIVSFVGGLSTFGFGTYRVVRSVADLQRVPAGVGGRVTIDSPGAYTIYYEPGALARFDQNESDPGVQAVSPDLKVATVTPPEGRFSYSFGDRAGHKIAELTADQPGVYQIEPQSAELPSGELAVGGNLGGWLAGALVAAGLAIVVFLAGLVLLIVGYVRRRPGIDQL